MDPQTESPLLALSPEIRNRIYEYALCTTVEVFRLLYSKGSMYSLAKDFNAGLTLVSKQVHAETIGIYYTQTTFSGLFWDLHDWWIRFPQSLRDKIKHVQQVEYWSTSEGGSGEDRVEQNVRACVRSYKRLKGYFPPGISVRVELRRSPESLETTFDGYNGQMFNPRIIF